jgi:hypothetical protein
MTTARQIITRAMQRNGILTKQEQPSADEASDALDTLNELLSSWTNEGALVHSLTSESFTLSGGVGTYTIGTGLTLNTVSPLLIKEAHIRIDSIDYPLTIIGDDDYNRIPLKTVTGITSSLNYNNGFPSGNIRLFPVPAGAYTLYLLSEKPLTDLTLDTVLSLPAGWKRAVIANLAMEIAPDYGIPVTQELLMIAKDSLASIRLSIVRATNFDAFPEGQNRNSVLSGTLT